MSFPGSENSLSFQVFPGLWPPCPSHGLLRTPSNMFPWAHKSNGISIGSGVSAGLTTVTDRQTDRPRYSVSNNKPVRVTMQRNNNKATDNILAPPGESLWIIHQWSVFAHYLKTWRHPHNRKYIMHGTVIRDMRSFVRSLLWAGSSLLSTPARRLSEGSNALAQERRGIGWWVRVWASCAGKEG